MGRMMWDLATLLGWQSRLGGRLGLHRRPEPTRDSDTCLHATGAVVDLSCGP
jgi:hypothetical protein